MIRNAFVANLSIIDVIMFNPPDAIREMLNRYTILDEEGERGPAEICRGYET